MKKLVLVSLAMLVAGTATAASVQDVAERYLRLVLAIGQHDSNYVDAYYGPPELATEAVQAKQSLASIRGDVQVAMADIAQHEAANGDEAMRIEFLSKQLRAMLARVEMLEGKEFSFDEETALLYDAVTPHYDRAYYMGLVAQVDELVPGSGPLPERLKTFRGKFAIPKNRLKPVFEASIAACRERTAAFLALPKGESFEMEFVSNKPWSAYNWYKGNAHSLIQINTELPIYIERAVEYGCHEGYPGHHVYNALLEQELVKRRNWVEFSVYPLYSPMSLIAEGSADYGVEIAFPDDERLAFEQKVLYPLAGIDPTLAPQYAQLVKLISKLSYADNDAAQQYLAGTLTREQTLEWLVNVALYPPEKAPQRLSFYDANRGYVINYNLGKDMVKAWVEKQVTATDPVAARNQRWQAFKALLSSPRLASGLH